MLAIRTPLIFRVDHSDYNLAILLTRLSPSFTSTVNDITHRQNLRNTIIMAQGGSENYTLPKNIRPIHYDLQLEPDFDTCRIQGKARIEVEFLEESIYLTINSIDIIVKDVLLAYGATERSVKTIT